MATIEISKHRVLSDDCYIFDTNVWLYIFGPMAGSNKRKQTMYSNLLKEINDRGAMIFITSLILSEYINRSLRICFEQWKDVNGYPNTDFKHGYRATDDYVEALNGVKDEVLSILQFSTRRPDEFNALNLDVVLSRLNKECDYNDSYILSNCIRGNLKLVSDDSDMQVYSDKITLITSNSSVK